MKTRIFALVVVLSLATLATAGELDREFKSSDIKAPATTPQATPGSVTANLFTTELDDESPTQAGHGHWGGGHWGHGGGWGHHGWGGWGHHHSHWGWGVGIGVGWGGWGGWGWGGYGYRGYRPYYGGFYGSYAYWPSYYYRPYYSYYYPSIFVGYRSCWGHHHYW